MASRCSLPARLNPNATMERAVGEVPVRDSVHSQHRQIEHVPLIKRITWYLLKIRSQCAADCRRIWFPFPATSWSCSWLVLLLLNYCRQFDCCEWQIGGLIHISGLSIRGQTATLCKEEGIKKGSGTRGAAKLRTSAQAVENTFRRGWSALERKLIRPIKAA